MRAPHPCPSCGTATYGTIAPDGTLWPLCYDCLYDLKNGGDAVELSGIEVAAEPVPVAASLLSSSKGGTNV